MNTTKIGPKTLQRFNRKFIVLKICKGIFYLIIPLYVFALITNTAAAWWVVTAIGGLASMLIIFTLRSLMKDARMMVLLAVQEKYEREKAQKNADSSLQQN